MSTGSDFEPEREAVAAASRALVAQGLVSGTAGNVSVEAGTGRAITPAGADLAAVVAGDVVVVSAAGDLIAGSGRPSSELPLHLAVGGPAVVHTHSHFATVLSCFAEEVPAVHYLMARFGGAPRVAPYATVGSSALADAAVEGLRDRTAVLLANHGAVVVAASAEEAVAQAALLESSCAIAFHARLLGSPRTLSAAELAEVAEAESRVIANEKEQP